MTLAACKIITANFTILLAKQAKTSIFIKALGATAASID